MILDNALCVSNAQAVTADAFGSNATIDLGAAGIDIAAGEPMAYLITVDVAADSTNGDETYVFEAHESANSNMSSSDQLVAKTIAAASLTAGSKHILDLPATNKRYQNLYYNVGGTTPTITVTAFLVPKSFADKYRNYPNGYTIS